MVATFLRAIKIAFKVVYGIIHPKTCQPVREIVLYILNTPGKLLGKAQNKSWKTVDFLNYESVRTLTIAIGSFR